MNPRTLCIVLVLSCPTLTVNAASPNVVLIISDDQSWTDFGFMGHDMIQTPNLDRLARQGFTFTRGYVPSSLCRPSLATLVTGLHAHQHKISGNDPRHPSGLPSWQIKERVPAQEEAYHRSRARLIAHIDRVDTLPRLLAQQGYVSHQSGKWWQGSFRRGGFTHGMTRGFPEPQGRHGDDGLKIGREGMQPIFDFIDEAQVDGKPFLVWYAPLLPHTPHTPPERFLNKYKDKTDSIYVAQYWAMCEWFDETCGQLLDYIDERELAKNTIVLFLADNGWIQKTNGRGYADKSKRSPNEGGVRTPIMMRWTGTVEPRWDETTLVSSIDLAPTILKACGVEPSEQMPGLNLADQDALDKRTAIFGEIFDHDVADIDRPSASLRYRWCIQGRWKLIVPNQRILPDSVSKLYDLNSDPREENDLAATNPDLVAKLTKVIDAWWAVP